MNTINNAVNYTVNCMHECSKYDHVFWANAYEAIKAEFPANVRSQIRHFAGWVGGVCASDWQDEGDMS